MREAKGKEKKALDDRIQEEGYWVGFVGIVTSEQ